VWPLAGCWPRLGGPRGGRAADGRQAASDECPPLRPQNGDLQINRPAGSTLGWATLGSRAHETPSVKAAQARRGDYERPRKPVQGESAAMRGLLLINSHPLARQALSPARGAGQLGRSGCNLRQPVWRKPRLAPSAALGAANLKALYGFATQPTGLIRFERAGG